MSELFPACFYCNNNANLLHNSLGSDHKITIFEIPEAMMAGDLSSFYHRFISITFRPFCLISNFISFPNPYIKF